MSNTSLLGSYGGLGNAGLQFRNRIINGDMRIDQRNVGGSVSITTPATIYYGVDRFQTRLDTSTGSTVQQSSIAPVGFRHSILITIGTGAVPAAGAFNYFGQRVEGYSMEDFAWGTANARTVTLSFWVRSSQTGTFGLSLRNGTATRSYVTSYTVNAANTWEQKIIVIPGETSGTWDITAGVGAFVFWDIGQGSDNSTSTTNAWQASNFSGLTGGVKLCQTSGATLYITGVQLEAGSVATPFEHRPIGMELSLCQRYFVKRQTYANSSTASGNSAAGNNSFYALPTPVSLRALPVLSILGNFAFRTGGTDNGLLTLTAVAVDELCVTLRGTHTSIANGLSGALFSSGGNSISMDAEL